MPNSTYCSPRHHAHELQPCHNLYYIENEIQNNQPQSGSKIFSNTNTPLICPIFQADNLLMEGMIPRPSENMQQNIQMPTITLPEAPTMPRDPEMLKNIDYLSSCVVKQGLSFEKMTQEKEANNPKFGFLFESEQGTEAAIGKLYYEWKKNALQATFHPHTPILPKKNIDSEPQIRPSSSNNCCSSQLQVGVNTYAPHTQDSTFSGEMDMDIEDNCTESNTIQIEGSKYLEEMEKSPIITSQDIFNSNLNPTLEMETSEGSYAYDKVEDISFTKEAILELNERNNSHSTYSNIHNGVHQICDENLFENASNTSPSSCGTPILESTISDKGDKGDLFTNFSIKNSLEVVEKVTLDSHHNLDELQKEVGLVSILVLKEGLEANIERIQSDSGDEKLSLNKDYELKESLSNFSKEKVPSFPPNNSNNVVGNQFYELPINDTLHQISIHKTEDSNSKNKIAYDIEQDHWHSSELKTQNQVIDHCGKPLIHNLNQQTPIEALISSEVSPRSLSIPKKLSKSKFDLDEFGRRMKNESDSENEEYKSIIAKNQYIDEECFKNKKRPFNDHQYEPRSQRFSQSPQSQGDRHPRKKGKYGECIYYAKGHCRRGRKCWFEHTNFENDKKCRKKRNDSSESCDYLREKNSRDASRKNQCCNISLQYGAKTYNIENELRLSSNDDVGYCEILSKSFDNDHHKRSNLLVEHNEFIDELQNSTLPSYNVENDKLIDQNEEKIEEIWEEDKKGNHNSCDDCSSLQSEDSKSSQNVREFSFEKNINHSEGLSVCHNSKTVGACEDYRKPVIESPNNSKYLKLLQTRELSAPETTVSSDHFSAVSSTASLDHTKDLPMLTSPVTKTSMQPQISQLPNLTALPDESSIPSQIPQFSNSTVLNKTLVSQVPYTSRVTHSLSSQTRVQTSMPQHIPMESSIPQAPLQTSMLPQVSLPTSMPPQVSLQTSMPPQVSLQTSMPPQVSLQTSMTPQIPQALNRSPPILNTQRKPFFTSVDNNIGNIANSTSINNFTPKQNPFQVNMPHLSSNNIDVVHSPHILSRMPTIGSLDHFSYPPPIPYPKLYTPISQNLRFQHDNIVPSQLYHSKPIMQHRDQNPLPSFLNPLLSYKNIHVPLSTQPQHYDYHGNSEYLLQPLNNGQSSFSNTWPQPRSYLVNSTPQGSYSSQVQNDIQTKFRGPLLTTTMQYMNKGFDSQPPPTMSYTSISNPTTLTYSIQPTHVPSVVQQDYGVPPLPPSSSFDSYLSTKYNTFQSYPPTQLYSSLQKPYNESESLENKPYEVTNTHPTLVTIPPINIVQKHDELPAYALEKSTFENVSPIAGGQSWAKMKDEKTLEGDAFECKKHNEKDKIQKETHTKIHGLSLLKRTIGGYVKEFLKPQWREGYMTKEAYKTIIKKTVSKVVGTVKFDNIPNNDEKVASYMDGARSKIQKLAQVVVQLSPSK